MPGFFHSNGGTVITVAISTTNYNYLGNGGHLNTYATEQLVQVPWAIAGVISLFATKVNTNTITATSTNTVRIAAANGNGTTSYGSGATGLVTDVTHTDSITAGQLVDCALVTGGTGTSLNYYGNACIFTPTSGNAIIYGGGSGNTQTTASTTFYAPINGQNSNLNTTESLVNTTFGAAGTSEFMFVNPNTNARGTTSTFNSRVSTANGNQTIALGAGSTAITRDTTNTDTITVGKVLDIAVTTSTGTGALNTSSSLVFIPTTAFVYQSIATPGVALPTAGTNNAQINGGGVFGNGVGTGANNTGSTIGEIFIASGFYGLVSANAWASSTAVYNLYGGAAAKNNTFTISSATTGLYSDVTNSDIINNSAFYNYHGTNNSGGSITFQSFGIVGTFITGGMLPGHTYPTTGNMADITGGMVH